ncbi:hypothetical protein SAMN05443633_101589 [Chryseobacterium arachidis]|uniref:Uncharacterized protein n=1 Tax=Chryseobacterium arachidis TaxID=1416778 RepID=A0A1M4USX7_9FLAO|nr:hypothetical protein [Chryseobacterium arachidis]SHE59710.1 hypothetical protein SAMN05443633_101589 [Chryseobacterium arachidis]
MDITSIIKNAVASDINWKHQDFHYIVDILSKRYFITIDLEEEKVAILALKNTVTGYLCLEYPLFFIENKFYSEVRLILNQFKYLKYIKVDSLSEQSLTVNPETYNKYFNYFENMDSFSAEDFYFYNIY